MIREYVDLRIEEVKTKLTEGLTDAFGALCSIMLIIGLLLLLIAVLCFALILLVGELLNNYALGAFIVCGALALVLVVVLLRQNKLFKGSFRKKFKNIFFESGVAMRPASEIDSDIKAMEQMIPQYATMEVLRRAKSIIDIFRSKKKEGVTQPVQEPNPEQ